MTMGPGKQSSRESLPSLLASGNVPDGTEKVALEQNGELVSLLLSVVKTYVGGLTFQNLLDAHYLRKDVNGNIIDGTGAIITGTPAVADYPALVALDEATYENFAVVVEALNRAAFLSDGAEFGPLNGQYIQNRMNVPSDWFVVPNSGITWTAADNGAGKVRLTASAAHGIAETDAEGSYLWLISGGTGWTAMTAHKITAGTGYVSTTQLDLDTTYTGGMGVPVFALAGTSTATSEIVLKEFALPALRVNSAVIDEFVIEFLQNASVEARTTKLYLDGVEINSHNVTATNTRTACYRWGFNNQNSASAQRALVGANNTGYGNATGSITETPAATGTAGKVLSIRTLINIGGLKVRVNSNDLIIRG